MSKNGNDEESHTERNRILEEVDLPDLITIKEWPAAIFPANKLNYAIQKNNSITPQKINSHTLMNEDNNSSSEIFKSPVKDQTSPLTEYPLAKFSLEMRDNSL